MKRIIGRAIAGAALGAIAFFAGPAWSNGDNLEKAAHILEQQSRAGKGEFITYLTGAAAAYRWAGTSGAGATATGLYCPPADTRLDGGTYGKIALTEYQRGKSEYSSTPGYPLDVLALALLRGLQEKFPCPTEAPPPAAEK
jgi:hypothetical protein